MDMVAHKLVILENTVPNPYLEIYRELLKNNFIFRFYDLEIGAENRFYVHIPIY